MASRMTYLLYFADRSFKGASSVVSAGSIMYGIQVLNIALRLYGFLLSSRNFHNACVVIILDKINKTLSGKIR